MITIIAAGLLVLFALFGTPLFIIFGAATLFGLHFIATVPIASAITEMYKLSTQGFLIAIPLFTFAGCLLAESRAPYRLVDLSRAFFGWLPGGLTIVVLIACPIFTALTGASGVTIIALGGILYPLLHQGQYPEKFNLGLITSAGSLGVMFPPALPLIIYGLIAGVSVEKLFVAGLVPGVITVIALGVYSVTESLKSDIKRDVFTFKNAVSSLRKAIWEIPLPIIILGGIFAGFFTAAEAAAITAFYVFIVEVLIYRDIKLTDLPRITKEAMILVGSILIILAAALGFTNFLVDQLIPMKLLVWMKQLFSSKLAFLFVLNIFLLIVGSLMDIFSAIVVIVPLIAPVAMSFGIDPVHLGIIFLTNLEIGYLTPPVGINLFISSLKFSQPVIKLYTATIPFLILLLIALGIITYVPSLSLKLVELAGVK
ncbi:MAG TPA: TRAP transporter large permease [bacterium]